MRRCTDGNPKQTSVHGQKTNMGHFGKHLGYDYGIPVGTPIKAPVAGKVTFSGWSASLGNWIELTGNDGRTHRLAHLNRRDVMTNQVVTEGQQLGLSGKTGIVTGPHCHHDVRKAGTTWNASFDNYVDWERLVAEANKPASAPSKMPPVDSEIKLDRGLVRTTFRAGTDAKAGEIHVKDDTYVYTVRGVRNYRVAINSASGGGDGVELALYYKDGKLIPGWKVV